MVVTTRKYDDLQNLGDSQYGAPPVVRLKHAANHEKKSTSKARVRYTGTNANVYRGGI